MEETYECDLCEDTGELMSFYLDTDSHQYIRESVECPHIKEAKEDAKANEDTYEN